MRLYSQLKLWDAPDIPTVAGGHAGSRLLWSDADTAGILKDWKRAIEAAGHDTWFYKGLYVHICFLHLLYLLSIVNPPCKQKDICQCIQKPMPSMHNTNAIMHNTNATARLAYEVCQLER